VPAAQVQIATIVQTFNILETIPHDSMAFTQGLTFDPADSGVVYESTGIYGRSDVRKVNIQTGEVILETDSPGNIFGEGLAYYPSIVGDYQSAGRLIHITWKNQLGYIFDSDSLQLLEEFQFSTARNEGWGITYNPNTDQFLVTDGSEFLHFWDRNRNEVKRIPVTLQTLVSSPPEFVTNLNEIEWDNVTGTVLANIWQTDNIVRIDPTTGAVITVYDMSQLFPDRPWSADVLNGIAISPENDLWVTGKLWPTMFRIELGEIVQY
jgi:glutaminyl-peptide cyclotransferase